MGNIRVLLADDHETVREGLRAILSADPDITVVGEAADGESAIAGARAIHPNIVVMDVTMPGLNGFQATQTIKESCPGTQVVVLTRHAHDHVSERLGSGLAYTAGVLASFAALGGGLLALRTGGRTPLACVGGTCGTTCWKGMGRRVAGGGGRAGICVYRGVTLRRGLSLGPRRHGVRALVASA